MQWHAQPLALPWFEAEGCAELGAFGKQCAWHREHAAHQLGRLYSLRSIICFVRAPQPLQSCQVFGIAFSTPVADSRGAPHALEHSVLVGGTKKYPVKAGVKCSSNQILAQHLQLSLFKALQPQGTAR